MLSPCGPREVGTQVAISLYVLIIPCAPLAGVWVWQEGESSGRVMALSAFVSPQPVELGFKPECQKEGNKMYLI